MATRKKIVQETPENQTSEIKLLNLEREVKTMADTDIKVPDNIEKINRDEWVDFLNTTPDSEPTWAIVGVGITDKATDYNAEVSEEKWIIERNARKEIDSYALSSSVEQTAYKNDPVFEFIDDIRYKLGTGKKAQTKLLEIDKYKVTNKEVSPKYRARQWNVAIEISSNGGDSAKINYNIHFVGDPELGTVSFAEGKPTFTEGATE